MGEQENERKLDPKQDPVRISLDDEELEKLAAIVGRRIEDKIYLEVGKTTVRSAFYILGAACLAILGWAHITEKVSFSEALFGFIRK